MGEPFLITGLPRTRTFWLSKLATVDGVSICEHEPSARMNGLEELHAYYQIKLDQYKYAGISDSLVSPMLPTILRVMPMQTLIVLRPSDEVIKSLETNNLDPNRVHLAMQGIASVMDNPLVKTMAFSDLSDSAKVQDAMRWIMPDYEMSLDRIDDFQKQVLQRKVQ